jgi:acyl-CoA oxidase
VRELIIELCFKLKNEAVGIIDSLAPPEQIIGSPFAAEDGDIYT